MTSSHHNTGGRRLAETPVLIALIVILMGVGTTAFLFRPSTPGDRSADAGFARDMAMHHAQAVEMALIIRDRTDEETLHFLTTDIILTQQNQIGQMRAWLDVWGLPPNSQEPPMAWMGHPTNGLMPGMASSDEIADLRSLPLPEAEILFLRLMIEHHRAGVEMAAAAENMAQEHNVQRLARAMVAGQQFEIDAMEFMLEERGVEPSPDGIIDAAGPSDHSHANHRPTLSSNTVQSILRLAPLALAGVALAWLVYDHRRHSRTRPSGDDE